MHVIWGKSFLCPSTRTWSPLIMNGILEMSCFVHIFLQKKYMVPVFFVKHMISYSSVFMCILCLFWHFLKVCWVLLFYVFLCCSVFLYGPFCHGALKIDMATLFTNCQNNDIIALLMQLWCKLLLRSNISTNNNFYIIIISLVFYYINLRYLLPSILSKHWHCWSRMMY